jgi:palmitoyl-protein thioesterase
MLNYLATELSAAAWFRTHIVQAQYFRQTSSHAAYQRYLETNPFLPKINNEGQANDTPLYREALMRLERFVMFKFENDDMVYPSASSWFGSRVVGGKNRSVIVPYDENEVIYQPLGLDVLDADGRLETRLIPGARHMQFSLEWFAREVVQKYWA